MRNFRILFICLILMPWVCYAQPCKPQINWSNSISFCAGNSIVLNAFNPASTYIWNTLATSSSITVSTSGVYYVTVTNSCGSTSDTITVYVDQPVAINLGADRYMCSSNLPTLSAPSFPNSNYLWQDASTNNQIAVTQSGQYHVRVTNACGSFYDTVNIVLDNPLNVNLGPDINNCFGTIDTIGFPAGQKGQIYWSTGDTVNEIIVSTPGRYWVTMSNACGNFMDTIYVTHRQGDSLDIGDTINRCPTVPTLISANIQGGSFLWSTNATTPSISVNAPGAYWVRYTDNCSIYYDTAYVINTGAAVVDLGPDTVACANLSFTLDAGNPGSSYIWSTGQGTRTQRIYNSGTFWVGVDNGCGLVYDTVDVQITSSPIDSIGDSAYFCGNGFVDVDAKHWGPDSYYYWDDGFRGRVHRYSTEGPRWVRIANKCDTLLINFYVKKIDPPVFDLGNDTIVCGFYQIDLNVNKSRYNFRWNGGSQKDYKIINQTGTHWVEVTGPCGVFTDSIYVTVTFPPGILPPKTITICQGGSTTIIANPADNVTQYYWSTGARTSFITVSQPGMYYLTASNLCDTVYDSVRVVIDQPIVFDLGKDTTLCSGQSLYLNVAMHNPDSARWSTGSRNGGLPIDRAGTYWVKLYNACGVFTDTIMVKVESRPQAVLTNAAFCIGGSVTLDASQPNINSFKWNNGSTASSLLVSSPGWYWVEMTNDCGVIKDSVYVREDNPIQPFSLGKDSIFCAGSLWLDPPNIPGATYKWQDGTGARRHEATVSGTYWVTITNACNSQSDSINILITGPPKLTLGDSVKFCSGSTFTLNAQNPGSTYIWNDGSTGQYLSSDTAGFYYVTITNPCGVLTDSVELITEFPLLNLELGNDTVICQGQSLILDADYSNVNTIWSTGHNGRYITVTATGTYAVEISNSCGVWVDSIFVEVQDVPQFWLGPDSTICNINGATYFEGPSEMETYQWSNGVTSQTTTFFTPGLKWLKVANKCFEYTDSIYLIGEDPIQLELGSDTVLCFGESLILSPGAVNYPISWHNGLIAPTREVTRTGKYWAVSKNSCGVFSDTINVRFDYPLNPEIEDTTVCMGDSAFIDISGINVDVVWFDGSQDKVRTFKEEGVYSAALTNQCGTFYKDFEVKLSNCDCPVFLANAFTPNADGINDVYKVVYDCDIRDYHFQIFNRWGEIIFDTHDPLEVWDGTYKGKNAPIGTYNYAINYSWNVYRADNSKFKRGIINLIR